MEEYKAIKTFYNGNYFRSRLEARWAIFFDDMEIKYQYEIDGFIGHGGTWYLPDFYFPDYDVFGEVKGTDKQLFECQEKISGAIDFDSTPISKGLLLFGPIPYCPDKNSDYQVEGNFLFWNEGIVLSHFLIQSLNEYGRFIICTKSRGIDYSSYPNLPKKTSVNMKILMYEGPSLLDTSLNDAKTSRFEFGENKKCN